MSRPPCVPKDAAHRRKLEGQARWRRSHRAQLREQQNEKNHRWRAYHASRRDPESIDLYQNGLQVLEPERLEHPVFIVVTPEGDRYVELWEDTDDLPNPAANTKKKGSHAYVRKARKRPQFPREPLSPNPATRSESTPQKERHITKE